MFSGLVNIVPTHSTVITHPNWHLTYFSSGNFTNHLHLVHPGYSICLGNNMATDDDSDIPGRCNNYVLHLCHVLKSFIERVVSFVHKSERDTLRCDALQVGNPAKAWFVYMCLARDASCAWTWRLPVRWDQVTTGIATGVCMNLFSWFRASHHVVSVRLEEFEYYASTGYHLCG